MTASALINEYVETADRHALAVAAGPDLPRFVADPALEALLRGVLQLDVYDEKVGRSLHNDGALRALPALRHLRTSLNAPLGTVLRLVADVVAPFDHDDGRSWSSAADRLRGDGTAGVPLLEMLEATDRGREWRELARQLALTDPHAVYPTSPYRRSDGHVLSSEDDTVIEAAMSQQTFTSVRIAEGVLDPDNHLLRDVWVAAGRCVAVIDSNVEEHHGDAIKAYFAHHDIQLDVVSLRAMEVDKGLQTVERLLGRFKQLGVSRREPVLVVGGGVLTDVAGLACSLYHRNTPYVMLATSLVAGVDAGPSPRTCCDGFGYKNLLGAYHPPVLTVTDRTFFASMPQGWLRHGMAEIIKMAVVKDAHLFAQLEQAGPGLVATRFGSSVESTPADARSARQILAGAIRSYVQAEYDNLYETHQARPHAYGHTWSPGFEIAAGLLHGHAVGIGMALGATVSHRIGWIEQDVLHRILRLISSFGLSLWHPILEDRDLLWDAQQRITQKRGGRLVAPLPRGDVGSCDYLAEMTRTDLNGAVDQLAMLAATYPRDGHGIEPLCRDVGLEDPSTVAGGLTGAT